MLLVLREAQLGWECSNLGKPLYEHVWACFVRITYFWHAVACLEYSLLTLEGGYEQIHVNTRVVNWVEILWEVLL